MPRNDLLSEEEKAYIQENCLGKTDLDMSKQLNRDIRTIRSFRKKLGITKKSGGKIANIENPESHVDSLISQSLNEDQRQNFFKTQIKNSLFYETLKEQLTPSEINFYLEEWGALCVQFEDIVATERRQIDELIKCEIMGNRVLRNIKIVEDEIENIQKEVALLRSQVDVTSSDEYQKRDTELLSLIKMLHAQSQAMSNDYDKNVKLRNSILNELNARRRDRVDQIQRKGSTFIGLIEAYRNREIREIQGRYAELLRIAKEKKLSDWRQPMMFADGVVDCVLLDDQSNLPEDKVLENSGRSSIVEEFISNKNSRILVIEDDHIRKQFFGHIFSNNIIDYANSSPKALEYLKRREYDLICFDYDLVNNTNSEDIARYVVNGNKSPSAKIIIHSMNESGIGLLTVIFSGERVFEICKFESLYRIYNKGDSNAENSIRIGEVVGDSANA